MNLKNLMSAMLMLGILPTLVAMDSETVSTGEDVQRKRLIAYKELLATGDCAQVVAASKNMAGMAEGGLSIDFDSERNELCVQGLMYGDNEKIMEEYKGALLDFVLNTVLGPLKASEKPTQEQIDKVFSDIELLRGQKQVAFGWVFFDGICSESRVFYFLKAAVCSRWKLDRNTYGLTDVTIQDFTVNSILTQLGVTEPSFVELTFENSLSLIEQRKVMSPMWFAAPICAVACYLLYKKYRNKCLVEQEDAQKTDAQQDEISTLS